MKRLLAIACLAACGDDADPLRVELDTGVVIGIESEGSREFLGIPYAAPPVGALRFAPPQPPAPWSEPLVAEIPASPCPQALALAGAGDEDCLYLNVWVPDDGGSDLPVMVWLHGGAFVFGSGSDAYYSGRHLAAQHGVIVVGMSYRLGAFGFLAHPAFASEDPAYPSSGNWGLDDQYEALRWVQRNIAAFGGDPDDVTIFGESAGGLSVCMHYVNPRTDGLFRAAISESGLCTTDILELPRDAAEATALRIADGLGCSGANAAACLRDLPAEDLLMATSPIQMGLPPGGPFFQVTSQLPAVPSVDGFVIPRTTRAALASGEFPARPLIVGANRDEGTLFHTSLFGTAVETEDEYRAAIAIRFPADVDAIVQRYPIAAFPSANRALAEISGDAFFVCPARRTARAVAATGAPVYYYNFQREPVQAFMPELGVFHSAEIPFLFGTDPRYPLARAGIENQATADALQGYWTQFARTMDPNGGDLTAWPTYVADADEHLAIDNESTVGSGYKAALCDFWDSI